MLLTSGGPDGEMTASRRYLSQRYSMPYSDLKGLLTDIGTEELAHFEMIAAMVHQLTRDMSEEEILRSGFDTYFVDHTAGIYPVAASGAPWSANYFQSKGDLLADLHENMAAEQKARTTYDNLLRLIDEGLRLTTDRLNSKNFYACNPSFDKVCGKGTSCPS